MRKTFSITLMGVLFIILGYLGYLIFEPFLIPIAWAVVFSILFYPPYTFMLKYLRSKSVASLTMLVAILAIILGPLSYLSYLIVQEVRMITVSTDARIVGGVREILHHPFLEHITERVMSLFNITEEELTRAVNENIMHIGQSVLGSLRRGVAGVITGFLDFLFMTISLFFLLRDGPDFAKKVLGLMPFSDAQKTIIATKLKDIVIATMFGGVVVAMVQGLAGGIAFALLGISSPVLWGCAMAVTAFLPIVGPFIVWIPAAAYLILTGSIVKGIILLIVGAFGISLIDNFLRPAIVGTRTKMHYLILFFTVLGGIKVFGLIGIILGPLVFALLLSLLEAFRSMDEDGTSFRA